MGSQAIEADVRSQIDSEIHLFVVSHRNLANRAIHFGATFLGATAFVSLWPAVAWLSSIVALVLAGTWLAGRVQTWPLETRRAWGLPVLLGATMANSALYGIGAAMLWHTGNPVGQVFAILILSICLVYCLMQYYASQRMFYAVAAPYLLGFAWITGAIAVDALKDQRFGVFAALAGAAVALGNLLFTARRQLAGSRSALRQARVKAHERERAAEAANHAKSAFLATMSHEIRTPLNGVLGMAQAMAAGELSGQQRQRLSIISQSGETLLAILNDILDLSKMEAGKIELERREFDLREQVQGVCANFETLADAKGVRLSHRLDADAAGIYLGDDVRLRQILTNLVGNAVKFTESGEVSVVVGRAEAGLCLKVRDTGIGIPPEALGRLFEDFEQADASTTRRFGGTGLGLAICRRLAQHMGGTIGAASEEGRGAVFTVVLPLPRLRDSIAEPAMATPPAAAPLEREIRVLAAEDNTINQLVLKTLLEQVGITPHLVANGREAVEAWSREAWDVILMDVQMPEMDGLAATREIRSREKAEGRWATPIIALTANALSHQVGEYRQIGMDDHVAKPIEAVRLFAALEQALEGRPPAADASADAQIA